MGLIVWDDKYSVGVAEIDSQHKQIFGIINDYFGQIEQFKGDEQFGIVVRQLQEYADRHFSTEEKYFEEFEYAGRAAHVVAHEAYKQKVNGFLDKDAHPDIKIVYELLNFLEDWWVGHISTMDQEYAGCFTSHGLR